MADQRWKNIDVERLLKKRDEQTTSANVGAYPAPFAPGPLRPPTMVQVPKPKEKDKDKSKK